MFCARPTGLDETLEAANKQAVDCPTPSNLEFRGAHSAYVAFPCVDTLTHALDAYIRLRK